MSPGTPYEAEGRSSVSFREAAQRAIHHAELKHAQQSDPDDPPAVYELTFSAVAKKGSSLSEYIVVAKGTT